ncbi:MAG: DUF2842 domain-containing protein [Hyphomicrobiaceae bacterium]|nr:DUF2842 domain-containing protein [Hyphomicrobiaceae bacterium]
MSIRTRKLIGAILLLAFIALYALATMAVAVVLHVNASKWVELAFYVVGGLAWVVPAALLVRWMVRPDSPPEPGTKLSRNPTGEPV